MNILAFFSNNGSPATGISIPTIRIRDLSVGLVITDDNMTEVGDGFYSYDFTSYDKDKDYSIRCDGTTTLSISDRYVYAGNENYIEDIDETITNNTAIQSISGSNNVLETLTKNISAAVWHYTLNGMPSGSAGEILVSRAYNGQVVIDSDTGSSGLSYPYGTHYKPVDNLNDAIEIAEKYSLYGIHTHTDLNINRKMRNYEVEGVDSPTITLGASADCKNTLFSKVQLEGDIHGQLIYIDKVLLGSVTNFSGTIINSSLRSDITLTGFRPIVLLSNTTASTNVSTSPKINLGTSQIIARGHKGPLRLENKIGNNDAYIELWSGSIEIMSSCVSGSIVVCGQGNIIDNSGPNCNVDYSRLLKPSDIYNIRTKVQNISAAVWDEELANHTVSGTYGNELATKADIGAATSTIQTSASSGTIIYGDLVTGDYTSTTVKNGIYWEIDENVTNGITVDFTFTIPIDDKPGSFNTYGYYIGTPDTTHYMELWAYNVNSFSWELLKEEYMPGGINSDASYSQEYYERHINRSNNEVKIRLKHHVTTYNALHTLYLDYVELTSINVILVQEIAEAVWSEPASGYITENNFGKLVNDIDTIVTENQDYLKRIIGLVHENMYIDNPIYDGDGNLTSARLRIYSDPLDVGTDVNVIGVYNISSPSIGPGKFTSWSQIRIS